MADIQHVRGFTDQEMLDGLRAAASFFEMNTIGVEDYKTWRSAQDPRPPSVNAVLNRWRKWTLAVEAAGLVRGVPGSRSCTKTEAAAAVRAAATDLGVGELDEAGYDRWRATHPVGSTPTVKSVVRVCGGWDQACAAAGVKVRQGGAVRVVPGPGSWDFEAARRRWLAGDTITEIAAAAGVTHQAVTQRLQHHYRDRYPAMVAEHRTNREQRRWHRFVAAHAAGIEAGMREGLACSVIAERLEVSYEPVRRYLTERGYVPSFQRGARTPRFSDTDVIAALVAAAGADRCLNPDRYETWRAQQPQPQPSTQTIRNRFGRWDQACTAAGLTTTAVPRVRSDRVTPETADRALRVWLADLAPGERPSRDAYDQWNRTHPEYPCSAVISWRIPAPWADHVFQLRRTMNMVTTSPLPQLTGRVDRLPSGCAG